MLASILVLGAMLGSASHALASSHRVLPLHVNHVKRQGPGNAFDPPETEICDPTWPTCGNTNFCFNEAEDYKCCPGEEHVCPPGSYCLYAPYCCPDEYTTQECADELGITLPPTSTATSTTTAEPTSTSTSSTPVIPTTTTAPPSSSSSAVPPTETPESPEFTGAANAKLAAGGAVVLGWLGVFGNLLV
ncbi:hypothetical protein BJX68DRAFT_272675 [Aspergillus pseudodeflectus]|uniref:GPI anchored serine-threonine rich protein n=1 Tax=Aspergillus pseudodeflectus TaxID=176178 RepID=A0ABR4JE79_9EURO